MIGRVALAVPLAVLLQTAPDTARVGPLEVSVGRNAFGACQLRLHNAGAMAIEAWRVSVRSDEARRTTIERRDAWRDPFHLPLEASRLDPGETVTRPLAEAGAVGPLQIRIHLVVRADGVAHGMAEAEAYTSAAPRELELLVERRRPQATEALALATRTEAAIAVDGVATVLARRQLSTLLDTEGDWNWWQVREQARAAEALATTAPSAAAAQLAGAIALLKTAHRVGTAGLTLAVAEPMQPRAVGRCDP